MLPRTCEKCGEQFELDEQEILDGSYSPVCTDCMRQASQNNERLPDERPIGELN